MRQWAWVWAWVCVLAFMGVEQQASAFNFLPAHLKEFSGPSGSQFGYSVALWRDDQDEKRVIVGAPQGIQTAWYEQSLPLGNIYYCDANTEDCHANHTLPMQDDPEEMKDLYLSHFLKTQGPGLGQTIVTEEGGTHAVVCAPLYPYVGRYIKAKTDGLCFFRTNLTVAPQPIELKPHNNIFNNSLSGFSVALNKEENRHRVTLGGPAALKACGLLYSKTLGPKSKKGRSRSEIDKPLGNGKEGWAMALGNFDGGEVRVATSSPTLGNLQGKVNVYPLKLNEEQKPLLSITEESPELGSFFGYAMISAHVNNDTTADLLVGAPFSTAAKLVDAGKVFVYYGPITKYTKPEVISGRAAWAKFGTSLAAVGDVNRDGYGDVAVGAPYSGDDGAGVVYIFNGGPNGLETNIRKAQVIAASEYMPGARGFGFSLAGGMDMDGNGYNDVAIGSLHSDTAVLLRSSPVITLHGRFNFHSSTVVVEESKPCDINFAGQRKMRAVCVDLHMHFNYTSVATFTQFKFQYELHLSSKNGTAAYGFRDTNGKSTIRSSFAGMGNKAVVYIQRSNDNINLTLNASVTVTISSFAPRASLTPILNAFTPSTFHASTTLTCQNESTCFTKPDLAIFGSGPPVVIGKGSNVTQVDVILEVRNDPGYDIEVSIVPPEDLSYRSVIWDSLVPDCHKVFTKKGITCSFKEVEADEKIEFSLTFTYDPLKLFYVPFLSFDLFVKNSVNSDTDITNNQAFVTVEVRKEATLFPRGFSNPEGTTVTINQTASEKELKKAEEDSTATFPVDYLGPRLEHSFSLNNRGPSPVEGAQLVFNVPLFWGEERLTYFMEQPKSSPEVTCDSVQINPLGLQPHRVVFHGYDTDSTPNDFTTSTVSTYTESTEAEALVDRYKRELLESALSLTTDSSYSSSSSSSSSSSPSSSSSSSSPPSSSSTFDPDLDSSSSVFTSTFPSSFQMTTDPAEYFSTTYKPPSVDRSALACTSPECSIVCNVTWINPGESVNVTFSSYLVTATVSKLGFRKVLLRTWVKVNHSASTVINPTVHATTNVYLLKPPEQGFSALPLWVLVLSIVVAIVLILIIILLLRKFGFFKRNRPPTAPPRDSVILPNDERNADQ